jgi:hypothetical protein
MIAATDSHAFNTLVCTDLGPCFGRLHVFQVGRTVGGELDPEEIAATLGGRTLMEAGYDLDTLERLLREGWVFRRTKLSDEFNFEAYRASFPPDSQLILAMRPGASLSFVTVHEGLRPASGDAVLAFASGS